jgi:hypothetical protein
MAQIRVRMIRRPRAGNKVQAGQEDVQQCAHLVMNTLPLQAHNDRSELLETELAMMTGRNNTDAAKLPKNRGP